MRLAAFGHMLCFLNCHLPAHMDKAEQRKDNFQTILSLQQFQGPGAQGILDHEYGPLGAWVGLGEEKKKRLPISFATPLIMAAAGASPHGPGDASFCFLRP